MMSERWADLIIMALTSAATVGTVWSFRYYRQWRRISKGLLSERHWAIFGWFASHGHWSYPYEASTALGLRLGPFPEIQELEKLGWLDGRKPTSDDYTATGQPDYKRRQYRARR